MANKINSIYKLNKKRIKIKRRLGLTVIPFPNLVKLKNVKKKKNLNLLWKSTNLPKFAPLNGGD